MSENKSSRMEIMNMEWPYFVALFVLVFVAMRVGFLPKSLAGMIPLTVVFGEAFAWIGKRIPIVKDYLGGSSVVVLFGCAAMVMYGIIPAKVAKDCGTFMTGVWVNYALAALCCGSIFGMSRKLLLKASIRYIPCILGGVIGAGLLSGIVGIAFFGSVQKTLLYITLPIMGGGTSAGAVPMSQMFAEVLHDDPGKMLAIMTPAVALGNCFAIITAGFLDKVGKMKPSWTGNGKIMEVEGAEAVKEEEKAKAPVTNISVYATGMVIAGMFLGIGQLIQKTLMPSVHAYAWMILLMVIVKMMGILPEKVETCCAEWYNFFIKNFANQLLAGLGIGMISLKAVIPALTPSYVILCLCVVVGATIGSALVGKLVGFYPIEAAITGGLCMANMGGSGDIATLGAANRMELMPFAAVSSRLGGALMLIAGSFLLAAIK